MSETAFGPQDDYLESVSQRLANLECTDQFGKPVGGSSAAEKAAVLECALQLAAAGTRPSDARSSWAPGSGICGSHAALLPLIKADAARTGRGILLLAAEEQGRRARKTSFAATLRLHHPEPTSSSEHGTIYSPKRKMALRPPISALTGLSATSICPRRTPRRAQRIWTTSTCAAWQPPNLRPFSGCGRWRMPLPADSPGGR